MTDMDGSRWPIGLTPPVGTRGAHQHVHTAVVALVVGAAAELPRFLDLVVQVADLLSLVVGEQAADSLSEIGAGHASTLSPRTIRPACSSICRIISSP